MECRIEPKVGVVIVAGGKGTRMGGDHPKQFRILGQAPVLVHTINKFADALNSSQIVVVLPEEHIEFWKNLSSRFNVADHSVVAGGSERFHSVKVGLDALGEQVDIAAIHDGVRPLVSADLIARCVECATSYGVAIPVTPISDSVRVVESEKSRPLDRSTLRAVQTPQMFDISLLKRAYRQEYSCQFTDDASVVESIGVEVAVCEGEKSNIKITTVEDLLYAQAILDYRDGGEGL